MEQETVFSIGQLLNFSQFEDVPILTPKLTKTEKREILMREIYDFYKAEYDKRRKENWKRYCLWCKQNRLPDSKENQRRFKREGNFIREISYESMKFRLKHIPADDLPYFVSTGKEFSHTGRSFGGWISQWYEKVVR